MLVDGLQFCVAGGAVDGNSLFGNGWNLVQVHPMGWRVHSWVRVGETRVLISNKGVFVVAPLKLLTRSR